MSDLCIVTDAIGPAYEDLLEVSAPTIERYAKKIGAELIIHKEQKFAKNIYYEKFIFGEIIKNYKRGMWIGSDCVISNDCPNVFDIVPECCIGGVNDPFYCASKQWGECITHYQRCLDEVSDAYKLEKIRFDGIHFNCDVLVASRHHSDLFKLPQPEIPLNGDQMLFNYRICKENTPRFTLSHRFNRIYHAQYFDDPIENAYIYHVAGLAIDKRKFALTEMLKKWDGK